LLLIFPEAIPLDSAFQTVVPIVALMMVAIFSVFPVIMILRKLVQFAAELSNIKALTQLEKGGFWSRAFHSFDLPTLDAQATNSSKFQLFSKKRGGKD